MQLNFSENNINNLLNFSNKLQLKRNKKLPKIIIIFDDNDFTKHRLKFIKIPRNSAILFRSYNVKNRKKLALEVFRFCRAKGLKFFLAGDIKLAKSMNVDGIHLPEYMFYSKGVLNWKTVKMLKNKLNWVITVAAHNKKTLVNSFRCGIDAAILSPIFPTKSHFDEKLLGITKLIKWTNESRIPIYALGGINLNTVQYLKNSGITGFAFQRGY